MSNLDRAKEIAKQNLRSCYGKRGIFAGLTHFKDYWARDSMFASLGCLAIGDHDMVRDNLKLFLDNMNKYGQVPLRVGKSTLGIALSFIGLQSRDSKRLPVYDIDKSQHKSVDQNSLLIIAAYNYLLYTKDKELIKEYLHKLEMAMEWNFHHSDGLLIEETPYSNWADSIKKQGKVLYTNVCHCHALKCLSEIYNAIGEEKKHKEYLKKHNKVKEKINELFWTGEHYMDWIHKDRHFNYFSTDGNVLAILWDIADKTKAKHIEESSHIFDINDVPSGCVHPKYSNDLISLQLKLVGLADYHNGLSWLWLGAMNSLAKYKLGMKKEAKELIERMSDIIVKHGEVYEVYEKDGNPVKRVLYKSEHPFAWSSGLFLYAESLIK